MIRRIFHCADGEIRNLGYYTGMTFEVFTPEIGSAVASGGRYDDLIGTFGQPAPAVGAALGIDRILLARSQQRRQRGAGQADPVRPRPAHVMVAARHSRACLAIVADWRAHGARVLVDVAGRAGVELWHAAQAATVPFAATWVDDANPSFDLFGPPADGHLPATPRRVLASAQQELLAEFVHELEDADGW